MTGIELFKLLRKHKLQDVCPKASQYELILPAERKKWELAAGELAVYDDDEDDDDEDDDDEPEDGIESVALDSKRPETPMPTCGIPSAKYGPKIFWIPSGFSSDRLRSEVNSKHPLEGWYYFDYEGMLSDPHSSDEVAVAQVRQHMQELRSDLAERSLCIHKDNAFLQRYAEFLPAQEKDQ